MPVLRRWPVRRARNGPETGPLQIPEVAAGRHPAARARPRELKAWLETLEGAHPLLACKELRSQLELLARFPDSLATLPELVDLLESPVSALHAHISEVMDGPLNEAMSRAAQQVLNAYSQVLIEFGHLHKRLINQLLDSAKGPTVSDLIAAAEVFAWQIRIFTTRYQSAPVESWQDLVQIYRITESRACTGNRTGPQHDVRTLFFASLLYQLCDTLRLTPQMTWRLFARTLQFADQLELRSTGACPEGIPVDIRGEVSPFVYARRKRSKDDRADTRVCVKKLLSSLRSQAAVDELTALVLNDVNDLQRMHSAAARSHLYCRD